jgi:hypothetical protein
MKISIGRNIRGTIREVTMESVIFAVNERVHFNAGSVPLKSVRNVWNESFLLRQNLLDVPSAPSSGYVLC